MKHRTTVRLLDCIRQYAALIDDPAHPDVAAGIRGKAAMPDNALLDAVHRAQIELNAELLNRIEKLEKARK